jgi:diguanylate cyclase (GGDEF)-like protein
MSIVVRFSCARLWPSRQYQWPSVKSTAARDDGDMTSARGLGRRQERPSLGASMGRRAGALPPAALILLLSAALAVACALLWWWRLAGVAAPAAPVPIQWWMVAAALCVADLKVITVHFRRESHAFSLSEVPAIIGIFVLSPGDYLLAVATGNGLALLIANRRTPIKIAFNLSNYLFLGAVSLVVFSAIGGGEDPGLRTYAAAFAASGVATVLAAVTIAAAITASGGAPQFTKLPEMIRFGALVATANTSVGLLAVTLLWSNPQGLWLLLIPVVTLFLAYQAWVSEREKHEQLELVYESSRILHHSPELDVALLALLDHARAMFRAELAEIVLEPTEASGTWLRTTSLQDEPPETIVPIGRAELPPALRAELAERGATFAHLASTPGGRDLPIRQAMVAQLSGEAGLVGVLTIANRMTEGTIFDNDDLRLLATIANQAAVALTNGQLEQSLAELSRLKEELRYQAYHDPLTDLPNRVAFVEATTSRIRDAGSQPTRPVVLLLDLDGFKAVNDTLGHAAGDQLLAMVADRIRSRVRAEDVAARLGGDEFAVLMDDEPSLVRAVALASRLVEDLGLSFPVAGQDVMVGASIGIVMNSDPGQSASALLGNADVAMYTAKADGRRRFAVFDPGLHATVIARHELSGDLARGIGRGELLVHHQPIVELASGQTVGVEALVRWLHPTRGVVPPDEFISLAEESGSIAALGAFVLRQACADVQRRNAEHPGTRRIYASVNVSAVQLQRPEFIDAVDAALAESELPPELLVVELTESAMFRDTTTTISRLQALRERGVRIAIDDFGTGYASLTYLRRFPIDILKVAKEFVGPADGDAAEWAFTGAIAALARRLGLVVVAEGIEEPGQLARLRDLGCDFGQGYLFARPGPMEMIDAVDRFDRPIATA